MRKKRDEEGEFGLRASGDPRYDELFKGLEEPLSRIADVRNQLKQAHTAFQKAVGTFKQVRNPTFLDSLMAMLFCFSASGEGYLTNLNFKLTPTVPFFSLNENLLYREHRGIVPAWSRLVTLAEGIPGELRPLERRLEKAIEESASKRDLDFAGEESDGKLTHALRTISSNHIKLAQMPSVLEELMVQSQEITDAIATLPTLLSRSHMILVAVGKQAYVDQNIEPRDIVEKYWTTVDSRVVA